MTTVKPFAAVAILAVGAFVLFHGGPSNSGLPSMAGQSTPPPPLVTNSPSAAPSASPTPTATAPRPTQFNLANAQTDATAFANSYLAYLYGKAPVESVQDVTDYVRARLVGTLDYISPAEQQRAYTVANVSVHPIDDAGGSMSVVVTVSESGAPYTISYTMEPQGTSYTTSTLPNFGT